MVWQLLRMFPGEVYGCPLPLPLPSCLLWGCWSPRWWLELTLTLGFADKGQALSLFKATCPCLHVLFLDFMWDRNQLLFYLYLCYFYSLLHATQPNSNTDSFDFIVIFRKLFSTRAWHIQKTTSIHMTELKNPEPISVKGDFSRWFWNQYHSAEIWLWDLMPTSRELVLAASGFVNTDAQTHKYMTCWLVFLF